jgi:deoxyadenosine/deoxycytidine kinase
LGKLVAVVGNTGVGKTTFVEAICRDSGFICAKEDHEGRPFQELFTRNHKKYALANQVDYLLRRADQEIEIRQGVSAGVQDGGLDQDFHIFSKLFNQKGYLGNDEFNICLRLYELIRAFLPPPDFFIWLKASPEVIADRFQKRSRRLSIAQIEDIGSIDHLLNAWLCQIDSNKILVVDSGKEAEDYSKSMQRIIRMLNP